jgi:outer membrane murein-binding lipoprotein Lpp
VKQRTIIAAVLALFLTGCQRTARLDGVSFSGVYVQGANDELALNSVVRELSNAHARLDDPDAPGIIVTAYENSVDDKTEITLTAWVSSGFCITASAIGHRTNPIKDIVAAAARDLIVRLAKKVNETYTPVPEPPLSQT